MRTPALTIKSARVSVPVSYPWESEALRRKQELVLERMGADAMIAKGSTFGHMPKAKV